MQSAASLFCLSLCEVLLFSLSCLVCVKTCTELSISSPESFRSPRKNGNVPVGSWTWRRFPRKKKLKGIWKCSRAVYLEAKQHHCAITGRQTLFLLIWNTYLWYANICMGGKKQCKDEGLFSPILLSNPYKWSVTRKELIIVLLILDKKKKNPKDIHCLLVWVLFSNEPPINPAALYPLWLSTWTILIEISHQECDWEMARMWRGIKSASHLLPFHLVTVRWE